MSYEFKDRTLAKIFTRNKSTSDSRPIEEGIEEAWEETNWTRIWTRIVSAYNIDWVFAAVIYLATVGLAIGILGYFHALSRLESGPGLQIIFGTAVFGTLVELLRRIYDTALKRLSVIDSFTSEIFSIIRVFASANIIGGFVRLYDKIDPGKELLPAGTKESALKTQPLRSGFADIAGEENYFSIFDHNLSNFGSLDPVIVNHITAFYTFLKAARDASRAIGRWDEPHYEPYMKREDVIAIVYLCFLMMINGNIAMQRLIRSKKNSDIVQDISAGVQLQCFTFLDYVVPEEDFRRSYINQRRSSCEALRARYNYWF